MKAPALLAAVLLLPAALNPAGEVPATGTASLPGDRPAVVPASVAPAPAHASWEWPLAPRPGVLRAFDPPDKPWMSGHRGVDLGAADDGVPVIAPEAGTVSFVGVVVDRPVITIDHGNGLRSSFEPVQSSLATGDAVAKGQAIGTLLAGHCGGVPCVHWGVRRGGDYLNPLEFVLDLRPSILLPLTGGPTTTAVSGNPSYGPTPLAERLVVRPGRLMPRYTGGRSHGVRPQDHLPACGIGRSLRPPPWRLWTRQPVLGPAARRPR